jgi:hypothetical protein
MQRELLTKVIKFPARLLAALPDDHVDLQRSFEPLLTSAVPHVSRR